jgi:MoaA/NifB/PqqE/SkfB family radical SAM enzyme
MAFMKYNSPLRLLNFILNEYERRTKKIVLSSRPYLINAEPTSLCNLNCLFCPTGKKLSRTGGVARVEAYEKLFREIGKFTYLITLHGWGEPLLHKELPEIVRLAHRHRIFTVVTTNGTMLTKKMSEQLILNGLDYLIVSIDGVTEDTYRQYRVGGSLELVMQNLKDLISAKNELGSSKPFIEWQFIVFRHNEHEMAEARSAAGKLGVDNLIFMPAYTEDEKFDASDPVYHLPKGSPLSTPSECKHLWSTLSFHWNGTVVPCCYDYFGRIPYGELPRDSFYNFWNNKNFQESRKIVRDGKNGKPAGLYCNTCINTIVKKNDI